MSQKTQQPNAQSEAKTTKPIEQATTAGPVGAETMPMDLLRAAPDPSITSQATTLQRLPLARQQAAVQQMNKVQGNRHVQRVVAAMRPTSRSAAPATSPFPIQAKLTVNAPDDQYEQEADQVAAQVMRMPSTDTPPPDDEEPPAIQTMRVQRAASEAGVGTVAPEVEAGVAGLQGSGSPLPDGERQFFEQRMGQDLSGVRVHTDGNAAQLSQDLSARAFTVGNNIAFGEGEYQPGTTEGRTLLAHELTHTIQQTGGQALQAKVQRAPDEEAEAEDAPAPETAVQQAVAEFTPADAEKEEATPVEGEAADLTSEGVATQGGEGGANGAAAAADASPAPAAKQEPATPVPQEAAMGSALSQAPTPAPAEAKAAESKVAEAAKPEAAAPITPPGADTTTEAETSPAPTKDAQEQGATTGQETAAPTSESQAVPQKAEAAKGNLEPPSAKLPQADEVSQASETTEATMPPTVAQEEEAPTVQRAALSGLIQRTPAPKSAEADPAFQAVVGKVKGSATAEKQHAPAQQKADEAAAAAKMPEEEKKGKAQDQQAASIAAEASAQEAKAKDGEAPGFDKAGFVSKVKARIDELTPSDPKEMEEGGGSVFDNAKGAVDEQVEAGKETAQGNVDDKVEEEPNSSSVAEKAVTALPGNNAGAAQGVGDAKGAAPKAKGSEEVEAPIQQESQALDQQMADAEVTEEQLAKSNEPSFQQALEAKDGAQTHAVEGPKAYRSGEQGEIGQAQGQAQANADAGTLGMHEVRGLVFGEMDTLQEGGKTEDETKRAEIGKEIDAIYQSTKTEVEGLLTQMEEEVQSKFNTGADTAKQAAVDWIKAETKKYKDERYNKDGNILERGGGFLKQGWDTLTDMPDEYYEIYRQGRDKYTEQMESVLNEVADIVGDYLGRAKTRIETGKQQIAEYVAKQPEELRQVAQETADEALGKFDELEQTVDAKQDELINSLAQQYNEKLAELDAELEKMKEEDKGLFAKAKDAIGGVIETIQELKAMLEGVLARAAGAIMKILEDPIGFLGNLLDAVKGGLNKFVANIGTHLQTGLLSWLTGTVAATGLQMPAQLDLPGIFSLVMQVLGLTWENIRAQIVRALGPQGEMLVGALETGWEVFQIIQSEGLAGLWRVVQEQIGDLKAMVLDEIKQMVIGEVIEAGIQWLIGILGGPAGAFIKAAQAIIKVVTWFIENGSRLMSLVNSVIDSVSAIANGDVDGAAGHIEKSLAQAIPTVISFLANLLGLGDIAKKVQGIIEKVKEPINKAIGWLVQQAKALGKKLLGKLGIGGKDGAGEDEQKNADGKVQEPFALKHEGHTLTAEIQSGKLELVMASNPVKFPAALTDAIDEVEKSTRPTQEKEMLIQILSNAREEADNIKYDWKNDESSLLKGTPYGEEQKVYEQYFKARLAKLANTLRGLAGFGIQSLDDFYADPPAERYLPGYPDQTAVGRFIRGYLYNSLCGWEATRSAVEAQEKPQIIQQVHAVQSRGNVSQWSMLIQQGLVEPGADINNYDPAMVEYHVDHIEPVAARWNSGGRDGDDSLRDQQLNERTNLRLVTGKYNTSKGSGGLRYDMHVGLNFTSRCADGGIIGARTIRGQSFLDASGKAIT